MSKFEVVRHEVWLDGRDVSDQVASVTLEFSDGVLVQRDTQAETSRLALMLQALTRMAAPNEGERE